MHWQIMELSVLDTHSRNDKLRVFCIIVYTYKPLYLVLERRLSCVLNSARYRIFGFPKAEAIHSSSAILAIWDCYRKMQVWSYGPWFWHPSSMPSTISCFSLGMLDGVARQWTNSHRNQNTGSGAICIWWVTNPRPRGLSHLKNNTKL